MRLEFGGKHARCFEYLHMAPLDEVVDGKIEIVGPDFSDIPVGGQMNLARRIPGKGEFAGLLRAFGRQLALAAVELRLDNVVFRMGFADTRAEARQLVRHGHFQVNGRRVNIPSFEVKPGSIVEVAEKSRKMIRIAEALETQTRLTVMAGTSTGMPALSSAWRAVF